MLKTKTNKAIILIIAVSLGIASIGYAEQKVNQEITQEKNVVTYKAFRYLPENPDRTDLTVEEQIRNYARQGGFRWTDYLVRLALCENDTLNPGRRGEIDSRDRGIFQINSYWHPEVSDECAFDVECATKWTMWRINTGHQSEWTCDKLAKRN